jgi:predicted secreted protein
MRIAVTLAAAALLLGCGLALHAVLADDPAAPNPQPVVVTSREHPEQVNVNKGGMLYVKLETQPGTGFGWKIAKNDPTVLAPEGVAMLEPDKSLPGGTEWQVFRFHAVAAGADDLEMHYMRAFDPAKPPAKTFRVRVNIR